MFRARIALLAVAFALLSACAPTRPAGTLPPAPSRPGAGAADSPAVRELLERIDRAAEPCADFAQFACGVPPPAPGARERVIDTLRSLLEDAAATPGDDPQRKLLGDFYAACMDEARVEATGIEPLLALLGKIAKVRDPLTFMRTVGELHSIGVPVLFRVVDAADVDDRERTLVYLVAGGLALGDRQAYLGDDPETRARLDAYRRHLTRMNELLGQSAGIAAENAGDVVRFETELARLAVPHADEGIPREDCTKTVISGLDALEPRMAWRTFLQGAGASGLDAIGLCSRKEIEALGGLLVETRQRTLQAYMRSQLIHAVAGLLGRSFVEEDFAFHGPAPGAVRDLPPRWQRCVAYTEGALGDLLAALYAQREVSTERGAAAEAIARATQRAFVSGLDALPWSDEATRRAARLAADAASVQVALPARPRDLSVLRVERSTFLVNVLEAQNLEFKRRVASSGTHFDPGGGSIPASSMEARFDRARGRVLVPAGLLAPPFDPAAPGPVRYGTLGVAVGSAFARGLDPRSFSAASHCVRQTLEATGALDAALAELGGVRAAYRAWRADSTSESDDRAKHGGLAADQLFFVAYARGACELGARGRVNATLTLTPEFARAFRCEPGSPLRPSEPCSVW